MAESNAEVPYNIKVAAITEVMRDSYQRRLEIIREEGQNVQEKLSQLKAGVKYFNFEKNAVFEAIRIIVASQDLGADILDVENINVPATIQNLVQLTGYTTSTVAEKIGDLEDDGLILINHGTPTTFELSDKAKQALDN